MITRGTLITGETTLAELEHRILSRGASLRSVLLHDGEYRVRLENHAGLHFGTGKSIGRAFASALDELEAT